ncbi:MAG TPA: signal peptidase II [Spirochaetota bacterium]|nr:signal peptidase II [Spirochaetota bacterium]HQO01483.1 signal peptidase II [Spirochaetota bacterium]HQP47154.1 signal peptidase II [Spirochaetota bacterium]
MRKHIIAGILLACTLGLDILTKYMVVSNVALHERINLFGSFVQITLIYNRGGLFGILQGYQAYFLVISIIVLGLLIVFYVLEKDKQPIFCYSMALIVSGALGNIFDRISGRPGVVDFVYIGNDNVFRWPAFNVADSVIVIGAVLLLIEFIRQEKKRHSVENSNQ